MSSKLTIWCNAQFPEEAARQLIAGVGEHRLIIDENPTANISAGGLSPTLAEADVAFGQPDANQVIELPSLRWTHLTSAGYTRYDRDDLRSALTARGALLTNSSSVFDEPCAQHLLAFMLAQARQLPQALSEQIRTQAWIYARLRPQTRLLSNQTVLLLGFGAIARRLAELLQPFRLNVVAVRRAPKGDESVPTHPIGELNRLLPGADHIVNTLPSSPSTDGLVDENCFAAMKPGAIFYNIGRGTTVDQAALIRLLESGRLGAAYLDVVDPEPLPADHPLWTTPNCWITPHVGGGHAEEYPRLVAHFIRNLRLFEAGEPLIDRVI
ncbi:MAG TPA: D-2-hydroxyacid dehydrogenase [Fimbriimonadaceae bacterium]|nr:D-2-hydroxyacid dehydrogenase [Fimbriimonadaceae bacterium]